MTEVRASALRLRLWVLVAALVSTALVPHPGAAFLAVAGAATVAAVAAPAYAGALALVVTLVVGWALAYGFDGEPSPVRAALFAVALYLLHALTSLAGSVPLASAVASGITRAWLLRCVPGIAAAALCGAVVGVLGRPAGSIALDIAGMAAVVAALGALVWAGRTLDRRGSS